MCVKSPSSRKFCFHVNHHTLGQARSHHLFRSTGQHIEAVASGGGPAGSAGPACGVWDCAILFRQDVQLPPPAFHLGPAGMRHLRGDHRVLPLHGGCPAGVDTGEGLGSLVLESTCVISLLTSESCQWCGHRMCLLQLRCSLGMVYAQVPCVLHLPCTARVTCAASMVVCWCWWWWWCVRCER